MPLKRLKNSIAIVALCAIASCPTSFALNTSYYATTSKLASGHWVKVAVSEEGIYQISYDKLRELGFENPERVQVFGYGATDLAGNTFSSSMPDDISATPTLHTEDGRILFYGQGDVVATSLASYYSATSPTVTRSWYDTSSYYFLHEVDKLAEIPSTDYVINSNYAVMTNHLHMDFHEEDHLCPGEGGIGYLDYNIESGESVDYTYHIKNYESSASYDQGSFCAFLGVAVSQSGQSISLSLTSGDNVTVGTSPSSTIYATSDSEYTIYRTASRMLPFTVDGSEATPTFTVTVPSVSMSICAMDRTILRYPRANRLDAEDPYLVMLMTSTKYNYGQRLQFSDVTPDNVVMWNISNSYNIKALTPYYDSDNNATMFALSNDKPNRLVAFDPTATTFKSPEVVGDVENQNLHGLSTPDLLIITTKDLLSSAQEAAEMHRNYQGLDVEVVVHDDIYNEFSSGARDAMAYRRFAKMFYDRDPEKFKYIMMWGPALYDNRSVTLPYQDRLVCYQNTLTSSINYVTNYVADSYFGMLEDGYLPANIHSTAMQVAVGRVSASSSSQAQSYLNKIKAHFENTPGPEVYARALTIGGEGDNNTHLSHAVQTANEISKVNDRISPFVLPLQLYEASSSEISSGSNPTIDAQANITDDLLERGLGFLSFSGHGGPKYVSTGNILNVDKASTHVYSKLPYMMFSSCDQYSFDRQLTGLVDALIFSNTGGAIAAVGACRAVYIAHNQLTCGSVASAYAAAQPGDTYGDAYKAARQILVDRYNNKDVDASFNGMVNALSYNLAGDPALPIPVPELRAELTKIGDTLISDEITIEPLKPITFTGRITDSDGNLMSDFNGEVLVELLDGPMTATTYNTYSESSYNQLEMTVTNNTLASATGTVTNGVFTATVSTPIPTYPDGTNHVVISATENGGSRTALGCDDRVNVTDLTAEQLASREFEAPQILTFYAGSEPVAAGGEIESTVEINATFQPGESGLKVNNSGVGTASSLCIDGTRNIISIVPDIKADKDGVCTLHTTVSSLSEGYHTIELTVANNAGLVSRESIDVFVMTRSLNGTLTIDEQPARTSATINLEGVSAQSGRLLVSDMQGNTVFTASNVTFPYTWNLTDNNNQPVANGRYKVSALISNDNYYGHTPAVELVVVK